MRRTRAAITTVAALAAFTVAGAIEVPQTRQEFVKAVAAGKGATTVETLSSDQPIDKVYAVLKERAAACLDVTVQRTANVGYVEHSSSNYNPGVRRVGNDRAEFTLQVVHNPRGVGAPPPPGGIYIMAADLKAAGGHRTTIVLYRGTMGVKKIVASLKEWFDGNPAPCPKLR